jgi:hypothetical protein
VRRGLVNLCLVLLFFVVGATEATAAVTVSRGGTLDVAGTAASETVTLTAAGDTITVASAQGVDGACGEGLSVVCVVDANVTVRAELGGGQDTLDAGTLDRALAVRATDGLDTVTTGAGDDSIVLEGEHNEVHAGDGRDVVAATGLIRGEGDGDFLTGDDDLDGGPGDDSLEAILGATLAGGDGVDSVRFTLTGPVRISLDGEANDGALLFASNVHADIEVLRGGAADDVLMGTDGTQELEGGPGADRLDGGPGADVLRGGDGNDELESRDGEVDDADCGAGDDSARIDADDRTTACEQVDAPTPTPTATPSATATPTPTATATLEPGPVLDAIGVAVSTVTAATLTDAPPTVRVSLVARVARARFLRRGVVASVHCSESCRVSSVLTLDARTAKRHKLPRRLARATGSMARAGTVRVTVKPTASVRRRLKRVRGTVKATLTTTATDGAGHRRAVARTLRLSR